MNNNLDSPKSNTSDESNISPPRKKKTSEAQRRAYKNYYERNKEHVQNKNKELYEKNKNYILDRNKNYYEKNKQQILERNKEYYEKNRERLINYQLNYYYNKLLLAENKEHINMVTA